MRYHSRTISVKTRGRQTHEITDQVQRVVAEAEVSGGMCNVFIHHTSASLIICENADPTVRGDLERFASRLVRDGDPMFQHSMEGEDDMPSHIRSVLTQTSLTLPVAGGRCDLGTWQGVFVWEHRYAAHGRRVTISVMGE